MAKADDFTPIGGANDFTPTGYAYTPQQAPRNAIAAGLSSGVDDLQGLGYSAGAAVADALGLKKVRDWANDRADLNQYESQINGRPDLERVEDVYDQPGKWLPYAGYQVAKQVPNIAGAIAAGLVVPEVAVPTALARGAALLPRMVGGGGMAARVAEAAATGGSEFAAKKAALSAGQTFAKQVVGGGAFNYAQGVGSLYQEANDGGDPNSGLSALAGGLPYAVTETLPEAMLVGRIGHGAGFNGNLLTRMGKAGATQGATGATSELLQNEMEMAYNGHVDPDQAFSKRLNSGVAGGLVEGLLGLPGGVRGKTPRAKINVPNPDQTTPRDWTTTRGFEDLQREDAQFTGETPDWGLSQGFEGVTAIPKGFDLINRQRPTGTQIPAVDASGLYGDHTEQLPLNNVKLANDLGVPNIPAARNTMDDGASLDFTPTTAYAAGDGEVSGMGGIGGRPGQGSYMSDEDMLNDPGAAVARAAQMKEQQRLAEIKKTALARAEEIKVQEAAAAEFKIKGTKGIGLFVELNKLHAAGEITDGELAENIGLLGAKHNGSVEKWIKAQAIAKQTLADSNKADKDAVMTALLKKEGKNVSTAPAAGAVAGNAGQQSGPVNAGSQPVSGSQPAGGTGGGSVPAARTDGASKTSVAVQPTGGGTAAVKTTEKAQPDAFNGIKVVGDSVTLTHNGKKKVVSLLNFRRLQRVLGMDDEGNFSLKRMTYEEAGTLENMLREQEGKKALKNPKESIGKSLAQIGVSQGVIDTILNESNTFDSERTLSVTKDEEGNDIASDVKDNLSDDINPMTSDEAGDPYDPGDPLAGLVEPDSDKSSRGTGYRVAGSLQGLGGSGVVADNTYKSAKTESDLKASITNGPTQAPAGMDKKQVLNLVLKAEKSPRVGEAHRFLAKHYFGTPEGEHPRMARIIADAKAKEAEVLDRRAERREAQSEAAKKAEAEQIAKNKAIIAENERRMAEFEAEVEKAEGLRGILGDRVSNGDILDAEESWGEYAVDGDPSWDDLTEREQANWVQATIARYSVKPESTHSAEKAYGQKFDDIADGARNRIGKAENASGSRAVVGGSVAAAGGKVSESSTRGSAATASGQEAPSGEAPRGTGSTGSGADQARSGPVTQPTVTIKKKRTILKDDAHKVVLRAMNGDGSVTKIDVELFEVDDMLASPGIRRALARYYKEGIGHALEAVDQWGVTETDFGGAGAFAQPGDESILFYSASSLGNNAEMEHITHHELGHAIDLNGRERGGAFSGLPEFNLRLDNKGTVRPMHAMMRDVIDFYNSPTDSQLAELLSYPLDTATHPGMDAQRIREELFAQLWAAYNNDTLRDEMYDSLPSVAYFMEAVHETVSKTDYSSATRTSSPDGRVGAQGAEQPEAELPQRVSQGRGGASAAEARASQWKDARVTFDGSHGVAYNESVTAGLRRIDEDDDVTFDDPDVTGAIAISGINQQHDGTPNAGRASDVLKAITRYADANGEVLSLVPAASGRVNQDGLVAWYKRNGFEQRASGIMVRQPNSTRANRINFSQTRPMAPSVKATATRLGGSTGAKFSKGGAAQSSTVAQAVKEIETLGLKLNPRRVTVVQSVVDLPAGVQTSMSEEGPTGKRVRGVVIGGRAYLIADNIAPGTARSVFLHEVGSHLGLDGILSQDQRDILVASIIEWADRNDGSMEFQLAQRAIDRVGNANTADEQVGSELMAYFIEEAVDAGIDPTAMQYKGELNRWFRTLWSSFKMAIRKLGWVNADKLTAQDVVDLAYGAAKLEMEGTWHGTAADFRKFDHRYMGSGEGAQAYGWGSYLAQRPGIAKVYFDADVEHKTEPAQDLQVIPADGQEFTKDERDALSLIRKGRVFTNTWKEDLNRSISRLEKLIAEDKRSLEAVQAGLRASRLPAWQYQDRIAEQTRLIAGSKSLLVKGRATYGVKPEKVPEGNLMRTDVNVADDEWLHWDKPLSEQSDKVRSVLENLPELGMLSSDDDEDGGRMYREIGYQKGSDKAASEYLDKLGVKGIKFLDAVSRDANNTILFDGKPLHYDNMDSDLQDAVAALVKHRGDVDAALGDMPENAAKEVTRLLKAGHTFGAVTPTRNLVIFNDKNIQRVASLRGADREKVKFSIAPTLRDAAGRVGGSTGAMLYEDAAHQATKAVRSLAFLHDLVDEYKDRMPSVREWYRSMQATVSARMEMEEPAERVAAEALKLKDGAGKVNALVAKATTQQKWPYDPEIAGRPVTPDPVLAQEFKALTEDEQKVVQDIFAHGEHMRQYEQDLMTRLDLGGILTAYTKLDGPYAPLKRFGNYIAILKSQELRDAEQNDDKKKVEELKKDPKHYTVSFFDTKGLAMEFANINDKANGGAYDFSTYGEKDVRVGEEMPTDHTVIQRVLGAIKGGDLDPKAKEAATNLIRDMYFQSIDEHHARVHGLKRKNIAGYSEDMVRAFLHHARAQANFLANLEHGGETNEQFYAMKKEARKSANDKLDNQDIVNTFAAHYEESLKYKETPIQDRMMALTSAWQLATSVGYHLANFMQPIMATLPKLASDFNDYSGAWKHLLDAYGTLKTTGIRGHLSLDGIRDEGLQATLQRAVELQLMDMGMDSDISSFEATHTGIAPVDAASRGVKTALHKLRQVSRAVETANRVSSAVAAYNMARQKGKTEAQAQEYAINILQTTQGDSTRMGAPLLLKRLPKIMTQYKKFQFMMAAMYVKAFRQAFKGATAEERAIGRRMLAYKLFHTSMAAGVMGMPLMNLVQIVFNMLGADGDEPPDFERWLKEQGAPDALLHGPLSFMGTDAKLGEEKVFSILPYADWDITSATGVKNMVAGLLGPAVSQGLKVADGIGAIKNGDYYKGVEKMMPSGVANGMKAFRVANDGYTLKNGDVMFKPDDINGAVLALDALGLPSSQMKNMEWLRSQQYQIGKFYNDRTKAIERDYLRAVKDGDTDAMREAREAWMSLQAGKDEMRHWFGDSADELKRQPLSVLIKYPQTVAKREGKLQKGALVE